MFNLWYTIIEVYMKINGKNLIIKTATYFLALLAVFFVLNSQITFSHTLKKNSSDTFLNKIDSSKIIEKNNINNQVLSILIYDNDQLISYILDYKTGAELNIEDLIKEDKINEFTQKITELVYLKYPKFIGDALLNENTQKIYSLQDDKLIMYFYKHGLPEDLGELFLNVYYNEIKDLLNIKVNQVLEYQNENGYNYQSNKKTIALTFDDGPHPSNTEKILKSLEENKARATFFMLGYNMEKYSEIVKKIFLTGNEGATHGYSHKNFYRMSLEEINEEITKTSDIYFNLTGQKFNLVRPPYGNVNEEILNSIPYAFVLWDIDTNDWRYKDSDLLVKHVLENVKDGDIILFHDTYLTSALTIEKLLPELYIKGFQVVNVSALAKLKNLPIEANKVYTNFVN